jgi:toluene monooxygenase system protein E
MAPSAFITNAAHFGAADEMRRVQRIAYWTKVLANAHGDEIATTALARGAWENDPAWQPLRRACEQLLVTHDWGEAFAARNLAVKPALDALLNSQFAALAGSNSDEFLSLLFAEFGVDSQRSQDWSAALVRYALERKPGLRDVLAGWLGTWQPRAAEAAGSLAAMFAAAPAAMSAADVTGAVDKQHHAFLEACGL